MSSAGPSVVLYDASGNPLVVADGAAPLSTGGLMVAGYDGANSRRVIVKAPSTAAVATDPALVVALSPNNPISTTAAADTVGTPVALNALNVAAQVALAGQRGAGFFLAAGTLIGTIVPELSFDGGTTWVATFFVDGDGTNLVLPQTIVFAANNTVTQKAILLHGGATHARVRVSLFTSGTATCTLRATQLDSPPKINTGVDSTNILRPVLVDTSGRLIIAPAGTGVTNGFSYGEITTTAVTNVPLRKTTYTEQTTNAQRSVSSASANDTSAGTGARTIKITYYDQTGAGPSTETLTLNGTTTVNTVSTTICYIEKIEVLTVGSTGSNVGIITLFAATAGGGGAIGTIAATDNKTLWAHHYVPTGKTCYITGLTGNNNNSSNNILLSLRARDLSVATSAELLISDTLSEGGGTAQTERAYGTPIKVAGPARIILYGAPGGTPSIISRGSFDFYEQ